MNAQAQGISGSRGGRDDNNRPSSPCLDQTTSYAMKKGDWITPRIEAQSIRRIQDDDPGGTHWRRCLEKVRPAEPHIARDPSPHRMTARQIDRYLIDVAAEYLGLGRGDRCLTSKTPKAFPRSIPFRRPPQKQEIATAPGCKVARNAGRLDSERT